MTSERSIPHLRDIFGLGGGPTYHQGYSEISHGYQQQQQQQQIDASYDDAKKSSKKSGKGKSGKSSKDTNYKTLTSGDVKTLERHLSMKKTIRKKIMRDLSQAFVEDPNEFKIENSTPEQLKAELSAEAMKFKGEKHNRSRGMDSNFLDMLRGDGKAGSRNRDEGSEYTALNGRNNDYENHHEDPALQANGNEKTSFWRRFTMKNKNKR